MKTLLSTLLITCTFLSYGQINNGLVAHFPFNGNYDDISQSSIISINNGCSLGTDRNGDLNSAVDLGINKYISFNDPSIKTSFPITVAFWVKFNSLSEVNFFFTTDSEFNNNNGYWMNNLTTGQVTISFGGGLGGQNSTNARHYTTNNLTLTAGNWHHVVGIIRDYNNMDIYIDCVKANGFYSGTGSTTVNYTNTETRIGANIGNNANPNGTYLNGSMDQFAIWNRELSPNEITFLCNSQNTLYTEELNNEEENFDFIIYPNPTNNIIKISLNKSIDSEISLTDNNGKILLVQKNKGEEVVQLNTSELSQGVYFIKVKTEEKVVVKRFVKQ